jgi:hypothetical protein
MTTLPVREMVLYKHGVGFFRREGEVSAEEVTLTFRHDEINDVLKSLAAFDREGGQVLGIHYQTPLDKAARLADSSIRLSDAASLFDLLRDLRGREVTLMVGSEEVRGRLIGLDVAKGEKQGLGDSLVSIASERDSVQVYRVGEVQGVLLHDDRAQHDLHFFLDTSMSEDLRRTVTVRLSPGDHRLAVYYVAPCPTWRVSYRVIAESDEAGPTGSALLQGWGLFDNRLDEDLKDVSVTLVAGQPISFIYDLYASRIPQRPVIEDEARVAPGPVEFETAKPKRERSLRGFLADRTVEAMDLATPRSASVRAMIEASVDEMQAAAPPVAEGHEAGEFFQYVVTTPVSVKRGDSAMVPILGTSVSYNKELLYNGAKLPDHPVAALRFANTTGLTLERGPVTLVEDGEYKGEAVVPFTKADGEVYLPYAVELGVKITERSEYTAEMAGLSIDRSYLLIEEYQVTTVIYTVENNTMQHKTVILEARIMTGYELFDMPNPDAATAEHRRWRVEAPAEAAVDFVRRERKLTSRREEVRLLDYRSLQAYFEGRWLDSKTHDRLHALLDDLALIHKARTEQTQLEGERKTVYERQGQVRENLNTLKATGDEGQLRNRMLKQLEASEDRLEEIAARHADLEREIAEAEARIEQTLDKLPKFGPK